MKSAMAWILNSAALLFGVVAAAAGPALAVQSASCGGAGTVACSVTKEWECETWGVCAILPGGGWFGCCWEGSITVEYEYYDNT